MHYTGMAAMRMIPLIHYIPSLFILSIVIAIVASRRGAVDRLSSPASGSRVHRYRAGRGVVMGFAIVGMHYTGMAAAQFSLGSICGAASGGVNTGWLALLVIIVTMAILAIALIISVLDMRLESRTSKLAVSLAEAESGTDVPGAARQSDQTPQSRSAGRASQAGHRQRRSREEAASR